VPTEIGSWGLSASAAAAYDTGTGENTAMFANIPTTLRLSNAVRINVNAGWQWGRVADRHYVT